MLNFVKGSLNDLSENLNDKDKIITREHFSNNFELLNEKKCFPYEFITKENIYNENLLSIENFYSSLKLDGISKEDYNKTLEIYKKLNCKNIKEYLDKYLKLDICLQEDIFNVFTNTIWDKFEIDCSKYITSCSLSLDLMLKYTGVKIELIRDIPIFDYVTCSMSFEDVQVLAYENKMRKRSILESLYIQDYNHTNILNDNIISVPLYIFNIPRWR